LFKFDIAPSLGYFLVDRLELGAVFDLTYIKPKNTPYSFAGTIELEPSFHLPIDQDERVFLFAGLGVGVGFDGRFGAFQLAPRAGANLIFGRSGVLTPSFRLPILFHNNPSTLVGIELDLAIGTMF